MWKDVVYEPGKVKAVVYKDGKILGEKVLKTAVKPQHIKLTPDRTTLKASGEDLRYMLIEVFDEDGNPCPFADFLKNLKIDGPGRIAGVGKGNPQSFDPFLANQVRLFYGKAMVLVQSGTSAGPVMVYAFFEDLKGNSVPLTINKKTTSSEVASSN